MKEKSSKPVQRKEQLPQHDERDESFLQKELAALFLSPEYSTLALVQEMTQGQDLEGLTLLQELNRQMDLLRGGDLHQLSKMLVCQAITLQTVARDCLMRMNRSSGEEKRTVNWKIAQQALEQSRKNIVSVADILSPKRTMVIHQQNNAVNQQINNGEPQQVKGGRKRHRQNPEVVANDGGQLQPGVPAQAIGIDLQGEATGKKSRTDE